VRRIIRGETQPAPNRPTCWWQLELQAFVTMESSARTNAAGPRPVWGLPQTRVKRVKDQGSSPVGPHTDCELSRDPLSHPHHLWPVCKEVPDPVTGGCRCWSVESKDHDIYWPVEAEGKLEKV
ncbi:hypothetical protein D4764_03G0007800, partial [Takifugu flavidus]